MDVSFTNSALFMTIAVVVATVFLVLGMRRSDVQVAGRQRLSCPTTSLQVCCAIRSARKIMLPDHIHTVYVCTTGQPVGHGALQFHLYEPYCRYICDGHYDFYRRDDPWLRSPRYAFLLVLRASGHAGRDASVAGANRDNFLSVAPDQSLGPTFANMLAGHTLIKVIAGFIALLGVAGVLPFALVVALTGLEILIAFLQAYVFAILTCLYINDAIHLH